MFLSSTDRGYYDFSRSYLTAFFLFAIIQAGGEIMSSDLNKVVKSSEEYLTRVRELDARIAGLYRRFQVLAIVTGVATWAIVGGIFYAIY